MHRHTEALARKGWQLAALSLSLQASCAAPRTGVARTLYAQALEQAQYLSRAAAFPAGYGLPYLEAALYTGKQLGETALRIEPFFTGSRPLLLLFLKEADALHRSLLRAMQDRMAHYSNKEGEPLRRNELWPLPVRWNAGS